jgi:hypothetical protein
MICLWEKNAYHRLGLPPTTSLFCPLSNHILLISYHSFVLFFLFCFCCYCLLFMLIVVVFSMLFFLSSMKRILCTRWEISCGSFVAPASLMSIELIQQLWHKHFMKPLSYILYLFLFTPVSLWHSSSKHVYATIIHTHKFQVDICLYVARLEWNSTRLILKIFLAKKKWGFFFLHVLGPLEHD